MSISNLQTSILSPPEPKGAFDSQSLAQLANQFYQAGVSLEPHAKVLASTQSVSDFNLLTEKLASPSSPLLQDANVSHIANQFYAQLPHVSHEAKSGGQPERARHCKALYYLQEFAQATSETQTPPEPKLESPYYFLPTPPEITPSTHGFDVQTIRRDFPILHQKVNGKPLIWLDNAATTQKPRQVIEALSHFYQHDNSNVHRGAHTLAARATDAYESARQKVQQFLGAASPQEIIFTRGTTEAINLVAQTYGRQHVGPGDEIVLTTLEHHANIVPWQLLAQEKEAKLRVVPITDSGEVILEEYAKLLNSRTKLVALGHVSNVLGTVVPVELMTAMAHWQGIPVLIDGAQSVPHFQVNVQALGADFYVFSGHKLFAPTGIGVLYGKAALLEAMPPWQGGGNMINHVTFDKTSYNDIPYKFEAGTGNIADAVGLGAAIDYLQHIGFEAAAGYEHGLLHYGIEQLATIPGLRLIGTAPHKVSVLSFIIEGIPYEQVGQYLARQGIAVRAGHHCAQPTMQRYGLTGTVRPSLAFYNTYQEIDILVAALKQCRKSV